MRGLRWALLGLVLLAGCSEGGKYSVMQPHYGGEVDFKSWPALPKGVSGYNLYLASDGHWEKINDIPITGGHIIVPYLQAGTSYYFYLTSVNAKGIESRPGGAFKRTAVAAKDQS